MPVLVTTFTHPGSVRRTNQDRLVVGRYALSSESRDVNSTVVPDYALVAVIDGMGGAVGGEVAAGLVADTLAGGEPTADETALVGLLGAANERLYHAMVDIPVLAGMGTTVAGVAVGREEALVCNVGDARVYLDTGAELVQATVDDSSPARPGAVTASLGGLASYAPIAPHLFREVSEGRRFLVVSDGISGVLRHDELESGCIDREDHQVAYLLAQAALTAGGPDNLSLAVVRWIEETG